MNPIIMLDIHKNMQTNIEESILEVQAYIQKHKFSACIHSPFKFTLVHTKGRVTEESNTKENVNIGDPIG